MGVTLKVYEIQCHACRKNYHEIDDEMPKQTCPSCGVNLHTEDDATTDIAYIEYRLFAGINGALRKRKIKRVLCQNDVTEETVAETHEEETSI